MSLGLHLRPKRKGEILVSRSLVNELGRDVRVTASFGVHGGQAEIIGPDSTFTLDLTRREFLKLSEVLRTVDRYLEETVVLDEAQAYDVEGST